MPRHRRPLPGSARRGRSPGRALPLIEPGGDGAAEDQTARSSHPAHDPCLQEGDEDLRPQRPSKMRAVRSPIRTDIDDGAPQSDGGAQHVHTQAAQPGDASGRQRICRRDGPGPAGCWTGGTLDQPSPVDQLRQERDSGESSQVIEAGAGVPEVGHGRTWRPRRPAGPQASHTRAVGVKEGLQQDVPVRCPMRNEGVDP